MRFFNSFVLLLFFLFCNCGNTAFARDVLVMGVTGGVHEKVMEFVKQKFDESGVDFDLEVKVFTDFIHPNVALVEGDLDINSYQHEQFMKDMNKQRGYDLLFIRKNFIAPMGVYSLKASSLSEITGRIIIPNDPTNSGRALLLLAEAGIIGLDKSKGYRVTVADITDYYNDVKVIEVEAPSIPRLINDAGAYVPNIGWLIEASMDPEENLLMREDPTLSPYVNGFVVRSGSEDDPRIEKFFDVYYSDETKEFIKESFGNSIVPAW